MPSGAERTVPIECDSPSEGMQSTLLAGVGQTPEVCVPRITVGSLTTLSASTLTRMSWETIGPSESGMVWLRS